MSTKGSSCLFRFAGFNTVYHKCKIGSWSFELFFVHFKNIHVSCQPIAMIAHVNQTNDDHIIACCAYSHGCVRLFFFFRKAHSCLVEEGKSKGHPCHFWQVPPILRRRLRFRCCEALRCLFLRLPGLGFRLSFFGIWVCFGPAGSIHKPITFHLLKDIVYFPLLLLLKGIYHYGMCFFFFRGLNQMEDTGPQF